MNVCVIGIGHVGLVAGAGLAELGNRVICVDTDKKKLANLQAGRMPFYEHGLEELVIENQKAERLFFTADIAEGVTSPKNIPAFFYKKGIDIGEMVDCEMVWGPEWKRIFLENTTLSENQIHVVGSPRFDIYRPPLNQLLMKRDAFCQKYGLDPQNKLVVWTSNFVNLERSETTIEYVQTVDP